jgi:hypothetical protein
MVARLKFLISNPRLTKLNANPNPKERKKMKAKFAICMALALCFVIPAIGQDRGTAQATIDGKTLTIDYGRPSLKGRDMLSKMTTGYVWRLGSNTSTSITTTGDLSVGGTMLKAGKYSLWLKKTGDNSFTLQFNSKAGIWGEPVPSDGFVAEIPLSMSQAGNSEEQLKITLAGASKHTADVTIQWGTALLRGSFKVG